MAKRLRSWLAETHGPQFELVRHFLSEQLANDLMASDQVRRFVITALAVLGCVGPLIVRLYIPKYSYLQSLDTGDLYLAALRADRLFFITLSMMAAALVTVIQWQALFPGRHDYLTLKPLPIRLYQVFVARFLSSFVVLVVVIADLNFFTSLLFPWLTSGRWQSPAFGIRTIAAHAVATFGAGLFAFFAIGALQGVVMNILPVRVFERLSVLIQALLATVLLAATPYVLEIPDWHETLAAKPYWMSFFPPGWFLGLYESLLGVRDGYFLRLREMAVLGMALTPILTVAVYFLCYRQHASRVLEQTLRRNGRSLSVRSLTERLAALLGVFVKSAAERGTFVFAIQTLRRSKRHKFVIDFCVAIALVLALQTVVPSAVRHFRSGGSWSGWETESILAMPLVIGAALISALCYVFQLPSDVRAGWIFRIAESTSRRELLDSTESLLILCGVAPVLLLTAPIEALSLGWLTTLAHIALAAILLLLFIEVRLYEWHKIPFTCSYLPGRRNLWQTMGMYLLLFGATIPTITYFEARLNALVLPASAAALGVAYFYLRSTRRERWNIVPLLFDESDEPLIGTVRLNSE